MLGLTAKIAALMLVLGLTGCATNGNPRDPLEGFNRVMFSLNDKVDQAALKPAAELYQSSLPVFVQTTIGNFFSNLMDVPTLLNQLLQGKFEQGLGDFMRIAVNSTLGLGGLLDIASEAGMAKHAEDFGQTLGRWGVPSGPYVVLPIFGASTMRDTAALPVDLKLDPWLRIDAVDVRNSGVVARAVDQRAASLNASNLVEEAALDRYSFVRDAYLQRRESRVFDGDVQLNEKNNAPRAETLTSSVGDSSPDY